MTLNSSPPRCCAEPAPAEAKVSGAVAALPLARLISSGTVAAGTCGLTISSNGVVATGDTATKSAAGS